MSAASLPQAIDTARTGRTLQRVLFSAAEGLGRSHALGALTGMPVLRVEVSRGRLVSQTLRALIGDEPDDDATWRTLAAAAPLGGLEPERAVVAAELLASLLGIRRADFRTAKLDEDSRREGAFLELARWLTERAEADGLVLAFDDAHLADDDGVAFMELLSQREEPTPMVLLVSHDADRERFTPAFRARRTAWLSDPRWARVELARPDAAMLQSLLVGAGAPLTLAMQLAARAKGTPGLALGLWAQLRADLVGERAHDDSPLGASSDEGPRQSPALGGATNSSSDEGPRQSATRDPANSSSDEGPRQSPALGGATNSSSDEASARSDGERRATMSPGDAAALIAHLPTTLDELRLSRVKVLGDEVLRACATLASLGGAAPLAALSAVSPSLPLTLQAAMTAGVVRVAREGPFEVCRVVDPRMAASLSTALSSGQLLGAQLAVGAWAAQALEQLDLPGFARAGEVLVPLATPALDGVTSSLWVEALAMTRPGRPDAVTWLEQAVRSAHGVRRLVLLRRVAEVKLFLGLPDEAIAIIASAGRAAPAPPQPLPTSAVGKVLLAQARGVLDRWDTLSVEEAMTALELVRAECVSYLVKNEDTQKAYGALEKRLRKLKGGAVPHLWIRWAKGWSWFLCEILGRSPDAMRACELVRQHVRADQLAADEDAIAFVRAEEVATCSIGEFARAMVLTQEHIALADRAGKLRDACLGWNAQAIVHYGQGDLLLARKAFERSLELARSTGWLRREAITLHNLTLVLTELGELDAAFAGETTYARLSLLVGNHAGKAEAPLVLAAVELARGRLVEAEQLIATARKAADANQWDMLVTWCRALTGRLRLLRYKGGGDALEVTKAKNDLMAAIEVFEERNVAWTEEVDPGEVVANYAVALKWGGQAKTAKDAIARTLARLPAENVVSRRQLDVASALVAGQSLDASLQWFDERGFKRRVALWRRLA